MEVTGIQVNWSHAHRNRVYLYIIRNANRLPRLNGERVREIRVARVKPDKRYRVAWLLFSVLCLRLALTTSSTVSCRNSTDDRLATTLWSCRRHRRRHAAASRANHSLPQAAWAWSKKAPRQQRAGSRESVRAAAGLSLRRWRHKKTARWSANGFRRLTLLIVDLRLGWACRKEMFSLTALDSSCIIIIIIIISIRYLWASAWNKRLMMMMKKYKHWKTINITIQSLLSTEK